MLVPLLDKLLEYLEAKASSADKPAISEIRQNLVPEKPKTDDVKNVKSD